MRHDCHFSKGGKEEVFWLKRYYQMFIAENLIGMTVCLSVYMCVSFNQTRVECLNIVKLLLSKVTKATSSITWLWLKCFCL